MQLFCADTCISICLKNKNPYVRLAAEDMQKDFIRVSTHGVCPEITETETDACIIEENTSDGNEPIKDEGFTVKSEKNAIRISADGYLGTMWGIYTFCEKYLGVEPCYLFNDLETVKHDSLEVLKIDITDKPESFGFRGVFINDEDLLTGWKDGGGIRYLDFPWYGLTVEESVINRIVETVLRLRQNLVIPASFLDIDNPPEKLLADCVAKRGIYLSQHHIEPLGVSAFTFENYCRKYRKTGEFSYAANPAVMEEAWTFYAKKWAEYEHVVWQIGLRGKGDRPVWQDRIPTEEERKAAGDFISRAYEKQTEIVKKVTAGKAKYFTSTLWM
ncbi:MAG: glycosyl hydrolase 115 family protein, partial [Eubacteriales bacterium]